MIHLDSLKDSLLVLESLHPPQLLSLVVPLSLALQILLDEGLSQVPLFIDKVLTDPCWFRVIDLRRSLILQLGVNLRLK